MTYDFRCRDAGATACRGHLTAKDEQEFKAKLAGHLKKVHHVDVPSDTIVDYLVDVAKKRGHEEPLKF